MRSVSEHNRTYIDSGISLLLHSTLITINYANPNLVTFRYLISQ